MPELASGIRWAQSCRGSKGVTTPMFFKLKLALAAVFLVASGITALVAQPQPAFPNRFIRIVSQFAAGSVSDITLRIMADRAGARLKTQVVIENMPTGGGLVAARTVKSSPADGHTLALLSNATAVTAAMFKNPGFRSPHRLRTCVGNE